MKNQWSALVEGLRRALTIWSSTEGQIRLDLPKSTEAAFRIDAQKLRRDAGRVVEMKQEKS